MQMDNIIIRMVLYFYMAVVQMQSSGYYLFAVNGCTSALFKLVFVYAKTVIASDCMVFCLILLVCLFWLNEFWNGERLDFG